jgi:hypothetical protein
MHPADIKFTRSLVPTSRIALSRLCVRGQPWNRQVPRVPLPLCRCYRHRGRRQAPPQRELPPFHCSYGLMRQTVALRPPLVIPRAVSLCRLLPAPAAQRPFPTLSLLFFPCVSGPILRLLPGCMRSLLPLGHWPSPTSERVGASQISQQLLQLGDDFGAAVISLCSNPQVCSPC